MTNDEILNSQMVYELVSEFDYDWTPEIRKENYLRVLQGYKRLTTQNKSLYHMNENLDTKIKNLENKIPTFKEWFLYKIKNFLK